MSPNKNQPGQTRSQKSEITPTFLSMPQNVIADELCNECRKLSNATAIGTNKEHWA